MSEKKRKTRETLTPKQVEVLSLLLEGNSDTKVAEKIGIDRGTIARWKKEPFFSDQYKLLRQEYLRNMRGRMENLIPKAIDVIQGELEKGNLKAALALIQRQDKIDERKEAEKENLPRMVVNLIQPDHNYTIGIEELLKMNKELVEKNKHE